MIPLSYIGGQEMSMDFNQTHYRQQYSTVAKEAKTTVQYSKEEASNVFANLHDVIKNPDYYPYYRRKLIDLGKPQFMDLVAKARAGSDTPAILFKWMLENPELVK